MKSTHSQPRLDRSLDSGWAVHIYDGKRQLLCTFGPSHGWSFVVGTAVGLLLAVIAFNLSLSQPPRPETQEPLPQTAPLQVD